jgi:hypothetical protein
MENEIQPQSVDVKSLIFTMRGVQVLLDSDVAMLYGYETRRINETANRNKKRFPEDFRFQLTKEEMDNIERLGYRSFVVAPSKTTHKNLKSQIATSSSHGGRRKLSYVYTEQGIAALSGLLKNDIAVNVSIGIMRAFVEMRKFISAYGSTFERLTNVEYKLLEHDKKFDEVFDRIQLPEVPQQGVFYDHQIYDAFKLIDHLIKKARRAIIIVDNYLDESVLEMLRAKTSGVSVSIITANPEKIRAQHVAKFNQQYPTVKVVKSKVFHDRFIIIDGDTAYHVGASLKDLGKKCFALSVIKDSGDLIAKVNMLL